MRLLADMRDKQKLFYYNYFTMCVLLLMIIFLYMLLVYSTTITAGQITLTMAVVLVLSICCVYVMLNGLFWEEKILRRIKSLVEKYKK